MRRRDFLLKASAWGVAGLLTACGSTSTAVIPTPVLPPTTSTTPTGSPTVHVLAEGLAFPEGPAFDPQGYLWCTELGAGNLVRWAEGEWVRISTGGRPNSLAFDRQGRAWVPDSEQNAIRRYDPADDTWETLLADLDGRPLLSPNDLTFDAKGNLIFTCPNFASEASDGYVVCLKPDGSAQIVAEGYYRPNGLDVIDGGKALVVADTFQKTIFKGAWDDSACQWNEVQAWAKVGGREGPDGMAPGADGLLYQAIYGDGIIRVIDASGETVKAINLPGRNPTNVAIDPSGKLGLVVTEAEKGLLLSFPEIQPGVANFDGGDAWK